MPTTVISITSTDAAKYEPLSTDRFPSADKAKLVNLLSSAIRRVLSGQASYSSAPEKRAGITIEAGGTEARGYADLNAVVATNTIAINGVTFTAVASGATNVQFNVGPDDTATAKNIADAVNASASASLVGLVRAKAVGTRVYFYAVKPGTAANSYALTGTVTRFTVSGATLTGGTAPTYTVSIDC